MIRKLDIKILKRIGMVPPRKYITSRMYGATIVSIHLYPDLLSPFLKDKLNIIRLHGHRFLIHSLDNETSNRSNLKVSIIDLKRRCRDDE